MRELQNRRLRKNSVDAAYIPRKAAEPALPDSTAVAAVACWGIRSIFGLIADNWISLILTCCLYALVTLCVDMCLLLGQKERSLLSDMVKRKLHIA